ncbi:MAG TPA: single-stranded DNA-binding protein [Tepidisphaeraceae bacterium]|jgi:single-strand DNA-binding protein|nr:single-stranded DNA-binding protein [Tepidisphaeraceae bacterium]
MANYNKVILVGNLTRDPQLRYLPSQMAVVDIGLAVNHKWKTAQGEDREEVCFVDCSAFGKQAEIINQYCQKGRPLLVEGRLKYETWEDKQGGGKRSKHKIVIEGFQLLGGRQDGGGGGAGGAPSEEGESHPAPRPASGRPPQGKPAPQQEAPISDQEHFKEDDIPF